MADTPMFQDQNINLPNGKVLKVNGKQVITDRQANVEDLEIAYTANNPLITPDGEVTVADGSAPTVDELLEICVELASELANTKAVLKAHGLME